MYAQRGEEETTLLFQLLIFVRKNHKMKNVEECLKIKKAKFIVFEVESQMTF